MESTVSRGPINIGATMATPMSSRATLSAALAKASTAVQLDQAQYYDGARKYYAEAVELINRVVARASDENVINKLGDIVSSMVNCDS
jgi:hypothetical protein